MCGRAQRYFLYTVCHKKEDTLLLPVTLPSMSRFQHSFTNRLRNKLKSPSYLVRVVAVPCGTLMSENQQQSETGIVINNKSQGSGDAFECGRIFNY